MLRHSGRSWALWDVADALGDRAAADWAATAFTTPATAYDEEFHLFGDLPEDLLGLCHGAAGVLAVADAFGRHARLPVGAALKARLTRHVEDRLARLVAVDEPSTGLLTGIPGIPGILAALLATTHGASRAWLPCLGLR